MIRWETILIDSKIDIPIMAMNTNHIILLIAAALVFASCIREEPETALGKVQKEDLVEITATSLPTKVLTQDGINILWENNDAILLRFQEDASTIPVSCTYTTTVASPSATAVFKKNKDSGVIPNKVDGKYIAVYPASVHYIAWAKKNNILFALNPDQIARDKGFDRSSAIMISSSDNDEFTFRHVVSYIRFTVTSNSSPFNKITVTSGDDSQFMVSRIRVSFDENFSYVLECLNSSGTVNRQTRDYVSLSTADNTNFTPGTYYVAINPDTYAKGLKFTFENSEGYAVTMSYDGSLVADPGYVMDIGTVGVLDYHVTLPYISIYKERNNKLGLIFYEDPEDSSKQKVVSAGGGLMKWATSNDEWRINNYKKDYDYVHAIVTSSDAYMSNPEDFPAIKLCDEMRKSYGGNWHVPSVDEMNILFNAYYGKTHDTPVSKGVEYKDSPSMAAAAHFDLLMKSIGGEPILGQSSEYWTCGQNTGGNLQYVNLSRYINASDLQTTERYVRCVRDVNDNGQYDVAKYPQTNIGQLIKGSLSPKIADVLWDTTYNVTSGVDYYKMKVITSTEEIQDIYLLRTDLSKGLDLKVAVSEETTSATWYKQALSEMATNLNTMSNPLYGMINADFCDNREPINPRGPVHCGGQVLCSSFDLDPSLTHQGLSYVGLTTDGKMTIAPSGSYESAKNTLRECTGAGVILLLDSEIQGGLVASSGRDPRTDIGYTQANIIWMLAVDGRHGTTGMTYAEMASIFKGLGCVAAVNLDGGGSTEMIVRNPVTGSLDICNWPSDPTDGSGGQERPRLNAWAIVKK